MSTPRECDFGTPPGRGEKPSSHFLHQAEVPSVCEVILGHRQTTESPEGPAELPSNQRLMRNKKPSHNKRQLIQTPMLDAGATPTAHPDCTAGPLGTISHTGVPFLPL